MRYGEDREGAGDLGLTGDIGWYHNEYDVLDTEQVYVAVSEHRKICTLQADLILSGQFA